MKKYAAFFDLDKTIISVNSARYIALYARKNGLLSKADIISGLYYSLLYKSGALSTENLMLIMTKWLENVDALRLKQVFDDLSRFLVDNAIRAKARQAVSFHREQSARTAILSASVKDVCEPLRRRLKMDDIICTEMRMDNGVYSGEVSGKYCYGTEKLQRVKSFCRRHRFSLEDAWYYADSIADLSVLRAVGHPVCVTPDRKLKKEARKRGWLIEIW